jgi:hypothetical protein
MVILEIDIQGGLARPAKGDPVIPGHSHRPSSWFSLQAVEVKSGDIHLLGLACDFQQLQDANALPDTIGANPAGLAGEVNLPKPLVPERADYSRSVDCLVYTVNRLWWGQRAWARGMSCDGFPSATCLEICEGWAPADAIFPL